MLAECPHCGTEYDVPDNKAGKRAKCGHCGQRFVVGGEIAFSYNVLDSCDGEQTEVFGPEHESKRMRARRDGDAAMPGRGETGKAGAAAQKFTASPSGELIALTIVAGVLLLLCGYFAIRWNSMAGQIAGKDRAIEDLQKKITAESQKNAALIQEKEEIEEERKKLKADLKNALRENSALKEKSQKKFEELAAEKDNMAKELAETKETLARLQNDPALFWERFNANSLGILWEKKEGEAAVAGGKMTLFSARSAMVICRLKIKGSFQLEYEAMMEEALDNQGFSDLSCILTPDENDPLGKGYFIGVGTNYNTRCRIARQNKDVQVKEGPVIIPKTPMRIRITWKDGLIQVHYRILRPAEESADNEKETLLMEFKDSESLGKDGMIFGLYTFAAKAVFDNIRITALP